MKLLSLIELLSLLSATTALPAPHPNIPSFFNSLPLPVVNDLDLYQLFNLTSEKLRRESPSPPNKRALTLAYILCTVAFEGSFGDARRFSLTGELLLTSAVDSAGSTNGANPVEVVIKIGRPFSDPVAGSITYTTNRYLWPLLGSKPDQPRVDFAYVEARGSTVAVVIDKSLAAANTLSVFNTASGAAADLYNPVEGGFAIAIADDGTLAGEARLLGRGVVSGGKGTYSAVILGTATQTGTTTL